MRLIICGFGLCLTVLIGCQSAEDQEGDQAPAFIGKWYHLGFEVDGEPVIDDDASSPFYEFERGGEMHAYKFPDAQVPDERGWFVVIDDDEISAVGDGDGGDENGVQDEGEIASAQRIRWEIDGDTLRMHMNMKDEKLTIIFQRGWPETIPDP